MNIIKRLYKNNLLKSSLELLLVMVSVLVVSYAWFIRSTKNSASDIVIKTKASRLLYISLDNGETWNTELNLNLNENFKFNNEVTSNGIDFYKALTKREDGLPITFTKAENGIDYLEFDILFKSNAPLGIFLDSTSSVLPSSGISNSELIGQNVTRKSSYGDFSRDLIASSVRIAFIENDYTEEKYIPKLETSLVWAPNKNYELIYNNGVYTFDIDSENEQDYKYINAQSGVNYELVKNLKDNLNTDFTNDFAGGDPMIAKIDETYNDGIKCVTVRIWIEGNDRETHTALTGGIFTLNLNFMGIIKEENKNLPNIMIETINNGMLNYNETMEYSKDNGNTWHKYSENSNPTFNTGDTVFVRYYETENYYASDYITLNY